MFVQSANIRVNQGVTWAALLRVFQGEGGSVLLLTASLTAVLVHMFMDCGFREFLEGNNLGDHIGVVRGLFWFLEHCGILSPGFAMLQFVCQAPPSSPLLSGLSFLPLCPWICPPSTITPGLGRVSCSRILAYFSHIGCCRGCSSVAREPKEGPAALPIDNSSFDRVRVPVTRY